MAENQLKLISKHLIKEYPIRLFRQS